MIEPQRARRTVWKPDCSTTAGAAAATAEAELVGASIADAVEDEDEDGAKPESTEVGECE